MPEVFRVLPHINKSWSSNIRTLESEKRPSVRRVWVSYYISIGFYFVQMYGEEEDRGTSNTSSGSNFAAKMCFLTCLAKSGSRWVLGRPLVQERLAERRKRLVQLSCCSLYTAPFKLSLSSSDSFTHMVHILYMQYNIKTTLTEYSWKKGWRKQA